ncbi:hypothetical protein GCM10017788_21940 [Amycolatopsis acidiphila]|nr:hypothetical protein GCM10017788_21940 [Amycolatopsis acidiphila]
MARFERHARGAETPPVTIVHHGPDGPDGYAVYGVHRKSWRDPSIMDLMSLDAATDEAFAGLWCYLLGVDLVDGIEAGGRPLDEPTALLFTDPRAVKITGGGDDCGCASSTSRPRWPRASTTARRWCSRSPIRSWRPTPGATG